MSTKEKIIFNILVILTIVLIYKLCFTKKSYTENKINTILNPITEATFNSNINSIKIASETYLETNSKLTLKEMIDKNILTELKDSKGNNCDENQSYSENKNGTIKIHLKCSDKEDTIEIKNESTKTCLYEYKKEIKKNYTDWSVWSPWTEEEIKEDNLTHVETKVEKIKDGITSKEEIEEAIKIKKVTCPDGYANTNGTCTKKIKGDTIQATLSYVCPKGYQKNGSQCQKGENQIEAKKEYHCPNNTTNLEFELANTNCIIYSIKHTKELKTEEQYICKEGYKLVNNKCHKTEISYKEVTYYRYQKRTETPATFDVKWSTKDDKELLNNSYIITGETSCEF